MPRRQFRPGAIAEAAHWILEQYEARERARVTPLRIDWTGAPDHPDSWPKLEMPPPSLSILKMGFGIFREARARHAKLGLWAVDYIDGKGPRIRIGPLIADPSPDLADYEIEIT